MFLSISLLKSGGRSIPNCELLVLDDSDRGGYGPFDRGGYGPLNPWVGLYVCGGGWVWFLCHALVLGGGGHVMSGLLYVGLAWSI